MKQILLTGDSRGVGRETVFTLLGSGYKVVGISRQDGFEAKNYTHIKYDLSDTEGIAKLYKEQIKPLGKFDGFVSNAAIAYDDIITNCKLDKLELMYKVNVLSPIMLTKSMIRHSVLTKNPISIIHVSSISVHTGYKGLAMYASTKGAMEAFSKNTAREWGANNVRSNIVCPGFMDTDMSAGLTDDQKNRIFNRNSRKTAITTQDVAKTIEFLVSDNSNGITGQVINVDNGTI